MRADFYGRKSTVDDGRSVASQEDEFREDCADEGLTPGLVFADPDRSASRYARKDRPDYQALREHLQSGTCEMLSLWESSRGSRDLADWVSLLDLCRSKGILIRIISHRRTYDVRVRRDWRTLVDEGVDSADESEKLSERVRRGKRFAAREGRPTARLAYGFSRRIYDERRRFVAQEIDEDQAAVVREIVKSVADLQASSAIARNLNERGIAAPLGGQWTGKQVRQIALKPSYAGLRVHQGEVIGDGKWQPIVDPDLWRRAYTILTAPGRKPLASTNLNHWLTGAITCGRCGGTFKHWPRTYGAAYACRGCLANSATARGIEAFIEPLILARLRQEDALVLLQPEQDSAEIQAAAAELKRLQDRLEEFRAEAAKPHGLSAAAVAEAERGLAPHIASAKDRMRQLTLPPVLAKLDGDPATQWPMYAARTKRDIARAVAEIVLMPGDKSGKKTFDHSRLARSRWVGDQLTWGEIWRDQGLLP